MISTIPEPALTLLGRLLDGGGHRYGVVVVGGAALLLRGLITRATVDVDVIAMNLYAAADDRPTSKHMQDLLAIAPTDSELDHVEPWVRTQDASEIFAATVTEVIRSVRAHRS